VAGLSRKKRARPKNSHCNSIFGQSIIIPVGRLLYEECMKMEGDMKYQRKFTRLGLGVAAAVLAMTAVASADTLLTLTGPIQGNTVGPQSASNPCIIAATQCQQPAGFGFNNFTSSGAISSYNMFSTTPTANVPDGMQGSPYTVGQLTGAVGSAFNVAIDVNTTAAAGETLQLFEVLDLTTNTRLYHYTGPTPIGNIANNGNGFADWTLGVVSLAGLPTTDQILFHAFWNNASDGGESFFLVPTTPTAVPLPGALPLFVTGLGMLGVLGMRRKKKATALAA